MCSLHILPILAPSHDSWAKFEVSSSPRARQGTLEGTVVGSSSSCIRRKRKDRYFNSRDQKSIQPLATCGISHVPTLPHTGTECSLVICRQLVCESSQFSWLFLFQDCSFDGFTCTHWSSKFPLSSRGMGHHLDMTPEFGVPSRWH